MMDLIFDSTFLNGDKVNWAYDYVVSRTGRGRGFQIYSAFFLCRLIKKLERLLLLNFEAIEPTSIAMFLEFFYRNSAVKMLSTSETFDDGWMAFLT